MIKKKSNKRGKKIEKGNNGVDTSSSSSKRVRLTEEDFEFDHEGSLEQAKRRRGAVKLEGYGSDETDTSEDDAGLKLYNRRKKDKSKDNREEEEDMFAEEVQVEDIVNLSKKNKEEKYEVENKKNFRYLDSNEILGQDFSSKDAYDEESGEPMIEAFNMKAELEEGKFDESGNYVRNKKDPNAFHDKWLEGISMRDIERARKAQEKKDKERKLKEAEQQSQIPIDRISISKEILTIMRKGETLVVALQRLGGGRSKNKSKKIKPAQREYKRKAGNKMQVDEPILEKEPTPEELKQQENKKQIERLTALSDKMMELGHFNIYEDTWEQILRNLKAEGAVAEDWMPVSAYEEKEEEEEEKLFFIYDFLLNVRDHGVHFGQST
ncbi:5673_t:CDS:2 [Entrophospora sp. SA101]|nr:5673_t:CDS:2 [Entrophospora sp. SA101]